MLKEVIKYSTVTDGTRIGRIPQMGSNERMHDNRRGTLEKRATTNKDRKLPFSMLLADVY